MTHWNHLPVDIHHLILIYLNSGKDLLHCCLLNEHWYQLSYPYLFQHISIQSPRSLESFLQTYCCNSSTMDRKSRPNMKFLEYNECLSSPDSSVELNLVQLCFFKSVFRTQGPSTLILSNSVSITNLTLSNLLTKFAGDLEHLVLDSIKDISCSALDALKECTRLKSLVLKNWHGHFCLELLAPCLRRLEVSRRASIENDYLIIKSPLEELKLVSVTLRDGPLESILKHCQDSLKSLSLSCRAPSFRLKGPGLMKIGDCRQLKHLKLAFYNISTPILDSISRIPTLEHVSLVHTAGLLDEGLLTLANCPLKTFKLCGVNLLSQGALLSFLSQTRLMELEVDGNSNMDDGFLVALGQTASLKTMNRLILNWFMFSELGLVEFLPQITHLDYFKLDAQKVL